MSDPAFPPAPLPPAPLPRASLLPSALPPAALALGGAGFDGFARVSETGPWAMITLRAAPDLPGLAQAVAQATGGAALPGQRRVTAAPNWQVGWMSPDEWLLIGPPGAAPAALAALAQGLAGQHHLAVDVSDARAAFRIEGARADQVLAKLCPVDLARLAPDEIRRTRAAQVAVAIWPGQGGYTLVSFRSVARYVFDLLCHAAQPGSELD